MPSKEDVRFRVGSESLAGMWGTQQRETVDSCCSFHRVLIFFFFSYGHSINIPRGQSLSWSPETQAVADSLAFTLLLFSAGTGLRWQCTNHQLRAVVLTVTKECSAPPQKENSPNQGWGPLGSNLKGRRSWKDSIPVCEGRSKLLGCEGTGWSLKWCKLGLAGTGPTSWPGGHHEDSGRDPQGT